MKQNYKALMLLSMLCAYGVLYSAATPDATLAAIATAATGLSNIPSEPMKTAYVKTHFSAAATSMAAICDMTTATFSSSQPSDLGIILGINNNTKDTFTVQQGSTNIATVAPGFNGDLPLHMTVLTPGSGSSSSTSPFNFISSNSSATSQLTVQVMTGTALATYLNTANTTMTGITLSASIPATQTAPASTKNVTLSLFKNEGLTFSAGQLNRTMASDLFLVVANESATGTTAKLNQLFKRIQVINLSNFSNTVNPYIISLCINPVDYTLSGGAVSDDNAQPGTYTIGIETVRFLDALPAHVVPLLMLPRSIYTKGTALNAKYAPYINSYALTISQQNAVAISNNPNNVSTYGPYYDLAILATHEPYAKFRIFGYLNNDKALTAVVDKNGNQPSGTILGDTIFADTYGYMPKNISSDLCWVSCNATGIEQGERYNFKVKFDTVAPSAETPEAEEFSTISLGFQTWVNNLSASSNNRGGLNPQPNGWMGLQTWQPLPGSDVFPPGHSWNPAYISVGNLGSVTSGQGYTMTGSLPYKFYGLTANDWLYGVKMIPVFYDVNKLKPIQNHTEFEAVSGSSPSALYFYLYNARTGKFLGLMPALAAGNGSVATYPTSTKYTWIRTGQWQSLWAFKPTVATTPLTGLTITSSWNNGTNQTIPGARATVNGSNIPYPGYAEMVVPTTGQGAAFAINNFSTISDALAITENAWKVETSKTFFTGSFTGTDTAKLQLKSLGGNKYLITLTDATSGSVTAFKVLNVPAAATTLTLERIDKKGTTSQITSQKLTATDLTTIYLKYNRKSSKIIQTVAPAIPTTVFGGNPAMAPHPKIKKPSKPSYKKLTKKLLGILETDNVDKLKAFIAQFQSEYAIPAKK